MYVVDYKDNNKNDVDDLVGYNVSHHLCINGFFCLFSLASDVLTPVLRQLIFFYSEYELNETVRINGQNDNDNFRSTFSCKGIFLTNQTCVFCFPISKTKHTSYKKGLSVSSTLISNN